MLNYVKSSEIVRVFHRDSLMPKESKVVQVVDRLNECIDNLPVPLLVR